MSHRTIAVAAALLFAAAAPSLASAQSFTFESTPLGSYSSLTETSAGLTLTVTTTTGGLFDVISGPPSGMQSRALLSSGAERPAFRFSFNQPVGFITFAYGDFGQDADDPVIQAFDAGGNLLSTFGDPYPATASGTGYSAATFGGAGASYFIATGTGGAGNSLYWEVAQATVASTVPEPSTYMLMGTGLLALGGVAANRRKRSVA